MKYLSLICLLFFMGCATVPNGNNIDCCMNTLKKKAGFDTITEVDKGEAETVLFLFCNKAKNDPDLALQMMERFRYSH